MSNKNADDIAEKLGMAEKSIGFFARTFNRYRGSDETPFSWFSSLVSFGSDAYYTDTPSFQEICEREGVDIKDAARKMKFINNNMLEHRFVLRVCLKMSDRNIN